MKLLTILAVCCCIVSCSSTAVKRKSKLHFEHIFYAKVIERKNIVLEANESKAGRVLVGLISAGPIGAIASANTEENFSTPKAYKYQLELSRTETTYAVSYSIVSVGTCVNVFTQSNTDLKLLTPVAEAKCHNNNPVFK